MQDNSRGWASYCYSVTRANNWWNHLIPRT